MERNNYNKEYYKRNKDSIRARQLKNRERISLKAKLRRSATLRGRILETLRSIRFRVKKNGWDYDLTADFLCDLWGKQKGLCALTGDKMSIVTSKGKHGIGNTVSVDRINSELGYTQDNVWLVTVSANTAKGASSYEEFVEMCRRIILVYEETDKWHKS